MLFQTHKAALKPQNLIASAYDAMFLTSAVVGFSSALLFAGSLDKLAKALLTTTGLAGLSCYTINVKLNEKPRKFSKAMEEAQLDAMKYTLEEEEEIFKLQAEIQGATRKVEEIINKSNPWEWEYWADKAKVKKNMPPIQELTGEPVHHPENQVNRFVVPESNVTTINQNQVDAIVSPDEMSQLETLANAYPKYIRIDSGWLDELCKDASNPDMSKRYNHHFCITGETQSGKSTLAGVIVNKISANSGLPSTVIGSDPKDAITRWLCKFSYLFEGFKQIDNWIQFAFNMVEQQKKDYAANPKETGEMFFLQDEVDTVFGNGKGFLGYQGANKKIAASQSQSAQSLWNFLVKYTAGMKGHYISLGQSPLSQDTGLSRPAYKSVCFIALGSTVDYIFEHPSDFLRVNKETQEILSEAAEFMKNAGLRFALVIPMRGNPYLALIPQFDVDSLTVSNVKTVSAPQPTLSLESIEADMMAWVQSLDELPSPKQVKDKWESLAKCELSVANLKRLLTVLGLVE